MVRVIMSTGASSIPAIVVVEVDARTASYTLWTHFV